MEEASAGLALGVTALGLVAEFELVRTFFMVDDADIAESLDRFNGGVARLFGD